MAEGSRAKVEKRILGKISLWKRSFEKEKDQYIEKIESYLKDRSDNPDKEIQDPLLEVKWNKKGELPFDINNKSNFDRNNLNQCIDKGKDFLISLQEEDKYWDARLDSNSGLNAQYLLLKFFLKLERNETDEKVIKYILNTQGEDGGWSIYYGGPGHLSYSVTCYFALKLCGHKQDEPYMVKAREYILAKGGIMNANVETRFWLALLDQYSWNGLPPLPVQIILAPQSFVFSIYNISYWCRTSLVPMAMIYYHKIVVKPPKEAYINELYTEEIERSKIKFQGESSGLLSLDNILLQMSKAAKLLEKSSPEILDKISMRKAKDWILQHQDDSGDWGGIYPAIQYSIMALYVLGYSIDSPEISKGLEALERFQIEDEDGIMLSACTSPVWDTAWSVYALNTLGYPSNDPVIKNSTDWLYEQQIYREGDWCLRNPGVLPGGWCFQFYNDFYPDTDDTAVVLMALLSTLADTGRHEAFKLGVIWLISMQNNDGGWGAFERNVDKEIMNYVPLNDIDNFLDQSTVDVTGRILELLGKLGFTESDPVISRAVQFIKNDQENFGAWFGRWGVNYLYGTWSVLRGLKSIGINIKEDYIQKAVQWIKSVQNEDGGWGESCKSYEDKNKYAGKGISTASQTGWALLTLLSAEEHNSIEVEKGLQYLIDTQNADGSWTEKEFTGTGFENAFYLRYYYYPYYFPMLAMGTYCRLKST